MSSSDHDHDKLSDSARSFLDEARHGDEPSADDFARVRAKVARRVAVAAAATATTTVAAKSAASAAGVSVATKALIVAAALGVGAAGVVVVTQQSESRPKPVVVSASASAPSTFTFTSTSTSTSTPTVEAPDSLPAEAAALAEALSAKEPSVALSKLDAHAAAYPNSVLAEERNAARVFALCDSGRAADARAAATAFAAKYPRSPHASRVSASCMSNSSREGAAPATHGHD